jgi:hypothetical protein
MDRNGPEDGEYMFDVKKSRLLTTTFQNKKLFNDHLCVF